MNYLKNWGIVGLLLCTASVAHAQKAVQGMLRDSSFRIVSGASVKLISGTDTTGTSSSVGGIFKFNNVKTNQFKINISSIGFEPFEQEYTYPAAESNFVIPTIQLKAVPNMLEEIVINGVVTVQVKGDTVEYAMDNLKLREGAVAEDALKKLQGVDVDKDGNVTAQGEQVTRVRINGKDFFGGDVKTATQNLPANIVQKMQIVDDYGDMANLTGNKTGESTKVLNIEIDPKYNKGFMTTLRVGAGTEDRYQTTGMFMGLNNSTQVSVLGNLNNMNAQLFDFNSMGGGARGRQGGGGGRRGNPFGGTSGLTNTGSIGLNIRHDFSDKLKVYGSYSYGRDNTKVFTKSNRITTLENGEIFDNSEENSNSITGNHRFEANVEWNITDKDYIKLTPQLGFGKNDSKAFVTSSNFLNTTLNNTQNLKTISNSTTPRYGISGLYNRKLNDKGRNFFFNFNYDRGATESDYERTLDRLVSDPNNATGKLDSIYELTTQLVDNKSWNAGTTFSYTEPLSEKGKLEITYDLNVNDYDNTNQQKGVDRNGVIINDNKLNFDYDYDYAFTTHRVGANYTYSTDKITYSVGAAVQPSILSGQAFNGSIVEDIDRKNFNIVPIAKFEYKFSRQKNLTVNYTGKSTEPSVNQILPFDVSTVRTTTEIGNPDLNPEFRHQVQARYRSGDFQKGNTFFAMLNTNLTNDKIVSFRKTYVDQSSNKLGLIQEISYLNETEEPVFGFNSFYHFGKSLKEKTYNLMFMGGISYNKNVSYVSSDVNATTGDKNVQGSYILNQGIMFRYNPSENLEINPGVRYQYNYTNNSFGNRNATVQSWTPNLIASINLTPTTIFGADISKTFNNGYGDLNSNPFIINTYVEQKMLKGQRGTLRLQAFDLLNQQTTISRTVAENYIYDTQSNRLARYFMLTFTFKLQKFSGMAPVEENRFPGGMRPPRM